MSANNLSTDELLDRYLSGAITAPQEAELERRAAADPVLAEALAGLRAFPEADHEQHIQQMLARAVGAQGGGAQVQGKDQEARVRPFRRYLAAASVLLLLAVAVFLLPRFTDTAGDLAMKDAPAPQTTESAAGDAATTPMLESAEPAPLPPPVEPEDEGTRPAPATSPPPARPPSPAIEATAAPEPEPPAPATAEAEVVEDVVLEETAPVAAAPPPPVARLETDRKDAERAAKEAAERAATERREQAALRRERMDRTTNDAGPPPARGEATKVSGRITDDRGEPIVDALVRIPGLPIGERTDTNGIFRLDIDATTSRIDISHPDYEAESFDIRNQLDDIQLSLEDKEKKDYQSWTDSWAATKVPISTEPGYALPEEGYNALRKRIEDNRPDNVPVGKVKLSFTVNPDGTLEDFVFKGRPSQETMDYIGGTIARTSIWNVMKGDRPVRVYFKVVFTD